MFCFSVLTSISRSVSCFHVLNDAKLLCMGAAVLIFISAI